MIQKAIEELKEKNSEKLNSINSFEIEKVCNTVIDKLFEYVPDNYIDTLDSNSNYFNIDHGHFGYMYPNHNDNTTVFIKEGYKDRLLENVVKVDIKCYYPNIIKQLIILGEINHFYIRDIDIDNKKYNQLLVYLINNHLDEGCSYIRYFINISYMLHIREEIQRLPFLALTHKIKNEVKPIYMDTDSFYIETFDQAIINYFDQYDLKVETSQRDYLYIYRKKKIVDVDTEGKEYVKGLERRGQPTDKLIQIRKQIKTKKRDKFISDLI